MPPPHRRNNPDAVALTEAERSKARSRLHSLTPSAKVRTLRSLQRIEDASPDTQRAIKLWASGVSPWTIAAETGWDWDSIAAIAESPAAQAHYAEVRATVDAQRVILGATVPWLELWQKVRDRGL